MSVRRAERAAAAESGAQARTRLQVTGFPGRYVQGPGALDALGAELHELGARRVAVITDDRVEACVGQRVRSSLERDGLATERLRFDGECTPRAIAQLAVDARHAGVDAIVGIGGGKTLDVAKGVAMSNRAWLVAAPTIASCDAATTRLVMLYDAEHRFVGTRMLARNPDVVVVDTSVIGQAPIRYFSAGVGAALSLPPSVRARPRSNRLNLYGAQPPFGIHLVVQQCERRLSEHAEDVLRGLARGVLTPEFQLLVESVILLGGVAAASCPLAFARGLAVGLSTVPALRVALYGECLAFGTLVERALEGAGDSELEDHAQRLARLSLPCSIAELGMQRPSSADLSAIADATVQSHLTWSYCGPVSSEQVQRAIRHADAVGRGVGARR
jgi:glycerol dehydrogenase